MTRVGIGLRLELALGGGEPFGIALRMARGMGGGDRIDRRFDGILARGKGVPALGRIVIAAGGMEMARMAGRDIVGRRRAQAAGRCLRTERDRPGAQIDVQARHARRREAARRSERLLQGGGGRILAGGETGDEIRHNRPRLRPS